MTARIRLATSADAHAIATIYAPFCTESIVSFEEVAPSVEEMAGRLAKIRAAYPYLVLEVDGAIAGYAYGGMHRERAAYRWTVEVTVYIHPQFQRQGVGRALYTTLLTVLTLQGFHLAVGGVTLPNPASEKLHEAVGFTPLGVYPQIGYKLGDWRDVGWYQKLLQPPDVVLREVTPIDELINTPEWHAALAAGVTQYRHSS